MYGINKFLPVLQNLNFGFILRYLKIQNAEEMGKNHLFIKKSDQRGCLQKIQLFVSVFSCVATMFYFLLSEWKLRCIQECYCFYIVLLLLFFIIIQNWQTLGRDLSWWHLMTTKTLLLGMFCLLFYKLDMVTADCSFKYWKIICVQQFSKDSIMFYLFYLFSYIIKDDHFVQIVI